MISQACSTGECRDCDGIVIVDNETHLCDCGCHLVEAVA